MPESDEYTSEEFPATRWSLVARAGDADSKVKRAALVQILTRYLPALRSHLVQRMRMDDDRADDLLQGFLSSKILEDGIIERAQKQRGKFRSLLLVALDRYCMNVARGESAEKRGAQAVVTLTEEHEAAQSVPGPEGMFELFWARQVIADVLQRMHDECGRTGRPDVWGVFEARVVKPMLEDAEPLAYGVLAERFGLDSPARAANLLITGKRMFVRVLRRTVGEYAGGEEEIDAEIRDLQGALARVRP